MFQPLALRGGAFFGVDHSLAGFRNKRIKEARDEDLLANLKVRNKYFAQVAAYGNSVVEPSLKLKVMVADVSQKIQAVLNAVNDAQSTLDNDKLMFIPNRLNLSKISETWNELVRAVNPYLTGPNQSLLSDEDTNQLKQMISNQLLEPLNKLQVGIAARLQGKDVGQLVINSSVLFSEGQESIINQIENAWYLPVKYGAQSVGIDVSIKGTPASSAATSANSSTSSTMTDLTSSEIADTTQTPMSSPGTASTSRSFSQTQTPATDFSQRSASQGPPSARSAAIQPVNLSRAGTPSWLQSSPIQQVPMSPAAASPQQQMSPASPAMQPTDAPTGNIDPIVINHIIPYVEDDQISGPQNNDFQREQRSIMDALTADISRIETDTQQNIVGDDVNKLNPTITDRIGDFFFRGNQKQAKKLVRSIITQLTEYRAGLRVQQLPTPRNPARQASASDAPSPQSPAAAAFGTKPAQRSPAAQAQPQQSPTSAAVAKFAGKEAGLIHKLADNGQLTKGQLLKGKSADEIVAILRDTNQTGLSADEFQALMKDINQRLPVEKRKGTGKKKLILINDLADVLSSDFDKVKDLMGAGISGSGTCRMVGKSKKKTDYTGPMESIMEEPKTPRPKRNVGSARPRPRKLPKESYQGFDDMGNEGFGMYGRAAPMQSKTELMMTENAHMPILSGNKGLPKIYGMENKLKNMGYYKPKY